MSAYETFLKNIGINFEWYINKDSSDLTGPEKLKLFQNIDFQLLLPNCDDLHAKLMIYMPYGIVLWVL